jgi:hypothetical protein
MGTWAASSLRVASKSLPPEQIAATVGTAPTRVIRALDPVSPRDPGGPVHQENACIYESSIDEHGPLQDHLDWLTHFVANNQSNLLRLRDECTLDARLGFSAAGGQGCFAIAESVLGLLGEAGVTLNVDLYGE